MIQVSAKCDRYWDSAAAIRNPWTSVPPPSTNPRIPKYAVARPEEATKADEQEAIPDDLGAFGYLRGVRDRALMLEIRFKDGSRRALGYAWLHDAEYNPSEGIMLQFGGLKVSLSGQNLNAEVRPNIRLFTAILSQHVTWIRKSDGPTSMLSDPHTLLIEKIRSANFGKRGTDSTRCMANEAAIAHMSTSCSQS